MSVGHDTQTPPGGDFVSDRSYNFGRAGHCDTFVGDNLGRTGHTTTFGGNNLGGSEPIDASLGDNWGRTRNPRNIGGRQRQSDRSP